MRIRVSTFSVLTRDLGDRARLQRLGRVFSLREHVGVLDPRRWRVERRRRLGAGFGWCVSTAMPSKPITLQAIAPSTVLDDGFKVVSKAHEKAARRLKSYTRGTGGAGRLECLPMQSAEMFGAAPKYG